MKIIDLGLPESRPNITHYCG